MKRVEFVSDSLSYIVLRSRWHNIFHVNVHATSQEKSEESKDSFYEEVEQVFDHFHIYNMKILLGHFNAKVGSEIILNQQLDRRVSIRIVVIMDLVQLTSTHRKIWWLRARCSLTGTFTNTPGPPLMVRLTTRLTTY